MDRFIDGLLKDFFSSEGRQAFAAGLDAAEADAQRLGATFAALTPAQKDQLFQKYEASSPAPDPTGSNPGQPWVRPGSDLRLTRG